MRHAARRFSLSGTAPPFRGRKVNSFFKQFQERRCGDRGASLLVKMSGKSRRWCDETVVSASREPMHAPLHCWETAAQALGCPLTLRRVHNST